MGNGQDDDCDGAVDEELPNGIGESQLVSLSLSLSFSLSLSSRLEVDYEPLIFGPHFLMICFRSIKRKQTQISKNGKN